MSSEEWAEEIRDLASTSPDIFYVLSAMRVRHQQFREHVILAAMAAREALDLSMRQVSVVIGWLKGEVSDTLLAEEIQNLGPGKGDGRPDTSGCHQGQ